MENVVVVKFGGTSLADTERIRQAARIVAQRRSAGFNVLAVASARAQMTDRLIEDARVFSPNPAPREMDMLLTSGERISAALLSVCLNSQGISALSLTGSQAGIITDDQHTNARIIEVRPHRVLEALRAGSVVIVGGFQGVSFRKEVTTLGRGGSDITAVALASALDAQRCEIYSDVDGVYSADPAIVPHPNKLEELSYQEMQELAESGAKVLHPKSVEFAKLKNTLLHAKSTFDPDAAGTVIRDLEGKIQPRVIGVASEERVVLLQTWQQDPQDNDIPRRVIEFCSEKGIATKQISFRATPGGGMTGTMIIPEKDNYHLEAVLPRIERLSPSQVRLDRNLSAVSMIGAGINDRPTYLLALLRLLATKGINLFSYHTSSFRISILVERGRLSDVVRLLHERFVSPTTVTNRPTPVDSQFGG